MTFSTETRILTGLVECLLACQRIEARLRHIELRGLAKPQLVDDVSEVDIVRLVFERVGRHVEIACSGASGYGREGK